jgi:hypothetical protein
MLQSINFQFAFVGGTCFHVSDVMNLSLLLFGKRERRGKTCPLGSLHQKQAASRGSIFNIN